MLFLSLPIKASQKLDVSHEPSFEGLQSLKVHERLVVIKAVIEIWKFDEFLVNLQKNACHGCPCFHHLAQQKWCVCFYLFSFFFFTAYLLLKTLVLGSFLAAVLAPYVHTYKVKWNCTSSEYQKRY